MAVASATAVLNLVLERDDLRNAIVGMPIYFHGMINFAAVFLLKAARTNFSGLTTVDAPRVYDLVQSCVRELRSQEAARQHLVYHLGSGLEDMLKTSRKVTEQSLETADALEIPDSTPMLTMDSMFSLNTFDLFQYPLDGSGIAGISEEWNS